MNAFAPSPRPCKLLIVSHYFEDHRGGVERVAGRLARELAARGLDVTWAATGEADSISGGALGTCALRAWNGIERRLGLPFPIPGLQDVARLVRAVRAADSVLIHDALYLTSLIARAAAAFAGKPVVIVQHIGEVAYRNPALRWIMRTANALVARPMLASANQVVYISETTRRHFDGLLLRAPAPTIFNGVDTDLFAPPADAGDKQRARIRFDLPNGSIALFVGRFVEKKGLHWLRRAAKAAPDITWAFAGWGPLNPDEWNLPNVRVYRGLAGADLADLYRAADLFALPSTGEGFPLVVQEALATGLPVVCGAESAEADPAASAWLRGVALVDANVDATNAALLGAIREQLVRPACAAERRQFAERNYSWSSAAARYSELLAGLSSQPTSTPSSFIFSKVFNG